MDYVHVESGLVARSGIDYSRAAVHLSKRSLVSLIHALGKKEFGFASTLKIANQIKDYVDRLSISGQKTYVDSGGYSIITGDVPFGSTSKFIDCYNRFLEYEKASFDYIFSLDIPFWGGAEDKHHLTKKNLNYFNNKSIDDSLKVLARHPGLSQKWFFVWHFKIKSQFEIWSEIFRLHGIEGRTTNYAIGGQVGLREMFEKANGRSLTFTPFTSMAVKSLAEHLSGPLSNEQFRLHILGIYNPIDRLQIVLLEQLFKFYHFCPAKLGETTY